MHYLHCEGWNFIEARQNWKWIFLIWSQLVLIENVYHSDWEIMQAIHVFVSRHDIL